MNPATDGAAFGFQANVVDASGYNETITSASFQAYHAEDDSATNLGYDGGRDQAQGTAFQPLVESTGNGSDESLSGELFLFNPSNTTYIKHFYSRASTYFASDYAMESFISGYFNVTGAIDDIQFKMSSGNMDAVIKMYGVG